MTPITSVSEAPKRIDEMTDAEVERLITVRCGYCWDRFPKESMCKCGLCYLCELADIHE